MIFRGRGHKQRLNWYFCVFTKMYSSITVKLTFFFLWEIKLCPPVWSSAPDLSYFISLSKWISALEYWWKPSSKTAVPRITQCENMFAWAGRHEHECGPRARENSTTCAVGPGEPKVAIWKDPKYVKTKMRGGVCILERDYFCLLVSACPILVSNLPHSFH